MNDDQLHDQLHAAVPEPPRAPDRAASARERHRRHRRRTTAAVVAGAAIAVAAVATVPALTTSDDPGVSRPTSPTPTPTPAEPQEFTCPAPRAQADTDTVPQGAVAVHLCPGQGIGFDQPRDALVTDIAEFADLVNAQPRTPPPEVCGMDLGIGYLLAFEYADGRVVPVGGELYGCHQLTVGVTTRAHPERPWQRFIELLRAQRDAGPAPTGEAARPACHDPASGLGAGASPVARPDEMVAATLCVRFETETEHAPVGVPVPAKDLPVLLADRAARAHPVADGECDVDTASWLLVGTTAWGDLTTTDGWCGHWQDRGGAWAPGPEAQRILDRLVNRTGRPMPTVDASSSASDVVAAYVDLLNADAWNEAVALWHPLGEPDLPTGYSQVDAKVDGERPLPRISAYRDATAVTALYRVVPADGSYTDYREATFTLGRDESGVFRIVQVRVGRVVETGR